MENKQPITLLEYEQRGRFAPPYHPPFVMMDIFEINERYNRQMMGLTQALRVSHKTGQAFFRTSKPDHKYMYHEKATYSHEELMAEDYVMETDQPISIKKSTFEKVVGDFLSEFIGIPISEVSMKELCTRIGFK